MVPASAASHALVSPLPAHRRCSAVEIPRRPRRRLVAQWQLRAGTAQHIGRGSHTASARRRLQGPGTKEAGRAARDTGSVERDEEGCLGRSDTVVHLVADRPARESASTLAMRVGRL